MQGKAPTLLLAFSLPRGQKASVWLEKAPKYIKERVWPECLGQEGRRGLGGRGPGILTGPGQASTRQHTLKRGVGEGIKLRFKNDRDGKR